MTFAPQATRRPAKSLAQGRISATLA